MRNWVALLAAAAVSIGGPAQAQSIDAKETAAISQSFGRCLVANHQIKQRAVKFVLSGEQAAGRAVVNVDCFTRAMGKANHSSDADGRWSLDGFRKLVANGLLRTDFAAAGPADFSVVPVLEHKGPVQTSGMPKLSETDLRLAFMVAQLGECAARKDPEAVRRVGLTDVNSPAELEALRNLAPVFGRCLPAGTALNFPRSLLRDSAVLAYTRLAYTLRAQS